MVNIYCGGVPPQKNSVPKKINCQMKNIKVFKNCLKWRENWSKIIILIRPLPPKNLMTEKIAKTKLKPKFQWNTISREENVKRRRPYRTTASQVDGSHGLAGTELGTEKP